MGSNKLIPNNKLNELTGTEWLKFQKSWFVHNPPPRPRATRLHPAKFPEDLCQQFIEFFTQPGQLVLDPMAGTGSALIAAVQAGRRAVGVELNPAYAAVAQSRLAEDEKGAAGHVICADARTIGALGLEPVDYVLTSPPYWDMLRRRGHETQQERRANPDLDVYYSDSGQDLGNLADYEQFLGELVSIYRVVAALMRPGAYATIIVKNVKKDGRMYPLAWELALRLSEFLALKDEKIWCQDNQRLAPYGMGKAWVSNTMHHYCLNFRRE